MDFTDPDYGVVHHLVVPAYGLQHGWYTAEAVKPIVAFMADHLHRSPTDHDRRRVRAASDGPVRVRDRAPEPPDVAWRLTVHDVDLATADDYVATVRAWAAAVVEAMA